VARSTYRGGITVSSTFSIVRAANASAYVPGGHANTENRRLVKTAQVEIILGRMTGGGAAQGHVHKTTDQAMFMINGTGSVMKDGIVHELGPDSLLYMPAGVFHGGNIPLNRTDKPLSFLVIYSPPLDTTDIFPHSSELPGKSVQITTPDRAPRSVGSDRKERTFSLLQTQNLEIALNLIGRESLIGEAVDTADSMLYLIEGSGTVLFDGMSKDLESGDLAYLPRGTWKTRKMVINRTDGVLKSLLIRAP
jgi:uncharacterized cupin superfamily protein